MNNVIKSVSIRVPSRLELTLIDLSVGSDRVNGGAGIAISWPLFHCRVSRSSALEVGGPGFPYTSEVTEFLTNYLDKIACGAVRVDVLESIPVHRGFGSKTATLLGVGRATAELFGATVPTAEIAKLAKRARTSGVGVNTFDRGGFLIDGGHPVAPQASGASDQFVPTRFSSRTTVPSALFSRAFPWPLLVVLPKGVIVEGQLELDHFRQICPVPRSSVHEIAYIVCFRMAAAVAEADYRAFCQTVGELQRAYFKSCELRLQSDEVRHVYERADAHGIDAIGLSSNGPALYALSRSPSKANAWLRDLRESGVIESYWWTNSPTTGATVRRHRFIERVRP
ncbi:MAG: hypothetical protein IT379_41970 [Deltaproteobacteria bacterium]|nr:hypothetical protein [Deltaproteobacteria bacterium]